MLLITANLGISSITGSLFVQALEKLYKTATTPKDLVLSNLQPNTRTTSPPKVIFWSYQLILNLRSSTITAAHLVTLRH